MARKKETLDFVRGYDIMPEQIEGGEWISSFW